MSARMRVQGSRIFLNWDRQGWRRGTRMRTQPPSHQALVKPRVGTRYADMMQVNSREGEAMNGTKVYDTSSSEASAPGHWPSLRRSLAPSPAPPLVRIVRRERPFENRGGTPDEGLRISVEMCIHDAAADALEACSQVSRDAGIVVTSSMLLRCMRWCPGTRCRRSSLR